MDVQLSLFDVPRERIKRIYIRDRNGRFATKEQAEKERLKRDAEYYKYMFEAEQRKNKPLIKALIEAQREIHLLKNR
ncbi:hypothetical protein [Proteiniphilum sp. X52]|uniref:hypothetical protein n=1 Tax=Proteiniphilum sp. X52 TaxID=2382159 RepID=UPI000F09CA7F|nr:hypothetical protein [Proteiniphilum sp. X52]RNC66442.1 hypothetical protein D7D25_02900 [Proteiniphilum sp. X52]